mmetsp:Transcript_7832/g.16332  ORF Transcript_7832/g.16332 Transcript_7832/m.16332 type:complete len:386 (-) Transcript_7832:203-1360(-)
MAGVQYQSYQKNEAPPSTSSWAGASPSLSRSATSPSSFRKFVWTVSAVSCCVVVSIAVLSSSVALLEDRQAILAANDHSPHLWFPAQRIRRAQRVADESRARFPNLNSLRQLSHTGKEKPDNIPEKNDTLSSSKKKEKKQHVSTASKGCEATIILVRHCEKATVREHCAYVGYERSVYLATLFGDDEERWPAPSYIYALDPDGRHNKHKLNFREIETVGPLSEKVNVPVDYSYRSKNSGRLSRDLLKLVHNGELCGKVALVSWKHSEIGHLAHRLGCGPSQGCPMDYRGKSFDETWQIKFVFREFEHSVRKSLKLPSLPQWKVFGSVQPEGFDPLAFSKLAGDYPSGGKSSGGSWKPAALDISERKSPENTDDWVETIDIQLLSK